MAGLLYIVGDFAGAIEHAKTLVDTDYRLDGTKVEAASFAALGDHALEAEALSRAIAISPDGVNVAGHHLARAFARAALDDLSGAREDFVVALDQAREPFREQMEEYIRHRLDALDRNGEGAPHRRLTAFPSVVQKWNYCGPAVLELCLRYLGLPMDQDFIAAAVKEKKGTPMYSIARFLREQGIETRRIEATSANVRKAIDLGFPVIVEDDYLVSGHVAVAIGYDERLGMIIAADPMTHAPRLRSFEDREDTSKGLRYSGILVMGRTGDLSDERRAAADAAGLVDQEHILILDEIARRDLAADAAFERPTPLEVAGLAARALALEPDYPRAALIRVGSLLNVAPTGAGEMARATLLKTRVRFPGFEDIREAGARWLVNIQALPEALAEVAAATEESPFDARAQALAGSLLTNLGQRALAFERLTRAVAIAPNLPDGTIALSALLRDELGERFDRREDEKGGERRFIFATPGTPSTWTVLDDEALLALADWVSECALAMGPESPIALLARADVLAIKGDLDPAQDLLAQAADRDPLWLLPVLRRVRLLELLGRTDDLAGLADKCLQYSSDWPDFWLGLCEVLSRSGLKEGAERVARRGVEVCRQKAGLVSVWYRARLATTLSEAEAARGIVELASERRNDRDLLIAVVGMLEDNRLSGHAARLLRTMVVENPHDAQAAIRLARIIRNTPAEVAEARALLEGALASAPWATGLNVTLAWLVMDTDPAAALAFAERVDFENPWSLEPKRQALRRLGRARVAYGVLDKMTSLAGSTFKARLEAAASLIEGRQERFVAEALPNGEPNWDDPAEVVRWIHAATAAGRPEEAVRALSLRRGLLVNAGVAAAAAYLSSAFDAEFSAEAKRAWAKSTSDPAVAGKMLAWARCLEGDTAGIEVTCGDDVRALAVVSADIADRAIARRLVERAHSIAPNDREVLAAYQAMALATGNMEGARSAAEQLKRDFPYEHQGPERLATLALLEGRIDDAIRLAETAVSEHYSCGTASAVLALALAIRWEWDNARREGLRGWALRYSPNEPPFALAVALAADRDMAGVEEQISRIQALLPGAPLEKVFTALRAGASRPSEP
jgi:tetratricopeptide (TPR) repeat protein